MQDDDVVTVPAGWYPDPMGLPQLRWWDNHSWTEFTSASRTPLIVQDEPRLAYADDDLPSRRSQRTAEGNTRQPMSKAELMSTLKQLEPPKPQQIAHDQPAPNLGSASTPPGGQQHDTARAAADAFAEGQRAFAEEQRRAEQREAEQRASEQRAAEQRAAQQRAAEQRAAQQRAADQQAAQQRAQASPGYEDFTQARPAADHAAGAATGQPGFANYGTPGQPSPGTYPGPSGMPYPTPSDTGFPAPEFGAPPYEAPGSTTPGRPGAGAAGQPGYAGAQAGYATAGPAYSRQGQPTFDRMQHRPFDRSQVIYTPVVWVIALLPLLQMVTSLILVSSGAQAIPLAFPVAIVTVAYVAAVVLAFFDHRSVVAAGHSRPAHWAIAFLGAPIYLIARSIATNREFGKGMNPILIWTGVTILYALSVVAVPGMLIQTMPGVFKSEVETSIANDAAIVGTALDVECPNPAVQIGVQFTCVGTTGSGNQVDINVSLQRSNGWIDWRVDSQIWRSGELTN